MRNTPRSALPNAAAARPPPATDPDLAPVLPQYAGGSIVNLMSSLQQALGSERPIYPPLQELPAAALGGASNIVLLVIDGLGFNYLNRFGAGSALHQHLRGRITSVFPSTTATAITTFFTGLAAQQHGLTGWFMYFREIGSVAAVLPFCSRLGARPLGEMGVKPRDLFDSKPLFDQFAHEAHVVLPRRIVDSEFSAAHCGRAARHGYASLQDLFGSLHAILRERAPKKFVYAYFSELDSLAHVHGVASKQVAAQFAALDEALAGFLRSIRGSETALIVTADHGFVDCDFVQLENHAELAGMLQLPLCGEPRAAYCYVQAGKVDQFEAYVRSEMANVAILEKAETLIAGNYYGIGTPHPRLRGRIGDYVLLMRPGYAIKDWLPGERRHAQIGVHGGLSADEMYVPLVVANA